ncbi:MAG: hypothetical protein ACFWUL_11345 [Dialister sp.]
MGTFLSPEFYIPVRIPICQCCKGLDQQFLIFPPRYVSYTGNKVFSLFFPWSSLVLCWKDCISDCHHRNAGKIFLRNFYLRWPENLDSCTFSNCLPFLIRKKGHLHRRITTEHGNYRSLIISISNYILRRRCRTGKNDICRIFIQESAYPWTILSSFKFCIDALRLFLTEKPSQFSIYPQGKR